MGFILSLLIILLFLAYVYLNFGLWKKTKSFSILILQGIVYLYTFHGYLLLYLGGKIGYVYSKISYFYGYPYYANFDSYFYLSLFYQLIFAVLFLGIIYLLSCKIGKGMRSQEIARIDFRNIILLTAIILIINIYLWRAEFLGFILNGNISYFSFKGVGGASLWYAFSKISLDFLSMILFFSIFVIFGVNRRFRERKFPSSSYLSALIFVLLGISLLFFFSVGDRLSLAIGVFFSFSLLLFDRNVDRKTGLKILFFLLMIFFLINSIRLIRTDVARESLGDTKIEIIKSYLLDLVITGESHPTFSLNAILKGEVDSFRGGSLKHALFIFIPNFVVKERPLSGYNFMVEQLELDNYTGWGVHYSADWYMNFGVLGIIIGAILLGLIFGGTYRLALRSEKWKFIFAGMIAILPLFFRNDGIAGFKNLVYYGILGLIVYFVCYKSPKSFLSFCRYRFFKRDSLKY